MQTYKLDQNGQELLKRQSGWWQRKSTLLSKSDSSRLSPLWLPLADGSLAADDLDLKPEMLDVERLVGAQQSPGLLEYSADRWRTTAPYGQIPWLEAILGAPIRATVRSGGMRTRAFVRQWQDWQSPEEHFNNEWFTLLLELSRLLAARGGGRTVLVAPTLRGTSDLAEAILGPELMSVSMYDHPAFLECFLEQVSGFFIQIMQALLAEFPRLEGGYVNPFGIWAPGTVVRTQCDATAFLSAAHYARWYLPYDLRICENFTYSIIHLHSCSLHVVDNLLAQPKPNAIQVTLEDEPKGPSLEVLKPIFEKILNAKPLLLEGKLSERQVDWLLEHLPSAGLAIHARTTAW